MSADLHARALDLALADAPPTGDAQLDAAVAQATADIAAIRAGLARMAEELPVPEVERRLRRRPRRAFWVAIVVAVPAAALGGWVVLGGGGPGVRSSAPAPHFRTDSFDYRPGGLGSSLGGPFTGYSLPGLAAISTSSATNAWIVGSVAWNWDGTRWRSVGLPTVSGDSSLSSVVTLGPRDTWAVGSRSAPSDEIVATHPLAEHWDGVRWSVIHVPLAGAGGLNSVSADAPNDIWAVGWSVPAGTTRQESDAAMRPLVAHWNGHLWRVAHLPAPGSDGLSQVVALAFDDVWVAGPGIYRTGAPIVRHWDGSRWQSIRAPFGARDPNFTFTASSDTDAWAVGGREAGGHSRTLAAHWNGHTWMIAPTPIQNTDSMLFDVHAISPTDVWALGQSQFMDHTGNGTQFTMPVAIYEHWNGQRWSLAPVASEREGLAFLAAAPDGTVWAAGGCYSQNIVTRWSGHAWQPVRHPPDISWPSNVPKHDRHPPATSCLSKSPT